MAAWPQPTAYAHPTPWEQDYPPLTLPAMFAASVAADPFAPLIDFLGRIYSYGAIAAEARAVAAGLQALGIAKGDRVGLYLPNVPIYVSSYYGALAAGATVVNFSPLYSVAELAHQVADSGTRLLITVDAAALLPNALAVLDSSPLERLAVGRVAEMLPPLAGLAYRLFKRGDSAAVPGRPDVIPFKALLGKGEPAAVALDAERDVALLQYTGGTSGTPKGARLSHQNLTANARQVNAIDPWPGERDVIVGVLPLFHIFANTCVLNRTVLNRGCIAMLPRFDARQVLRTIERTRATAMPGVPTMYQALLDSPGLRQSGMSSLRACISGGAPLAAPLKTRFEAITGARLIEGYGMSETAGVVSANPYASEGRSGTIGQPLPATRWTLLDKDDPTRPAPPGEPGELAVAGPQVMLGFHHPPASETETFIGGWLRTGDIATIATDGYATIVDRMKDMIAVSGYKVFPSRLEAELLTHPAVREAVVIGVPDAYRGESPKAFVTVQADSGETGETLRAWLNERVGKHERVIAVDIRDALPKTPIGKLDRKALRVEAGA